MEEETNLGVQQRKLQKLQQQQRAIARCFALQRAVEVNLVFQKFALRYSATSCAIAQARFSAIEDSFGCAIARQLALQRKPISTSSPNSAANEKQRNTCWGVTFLSFPFWFYFHALGTMHKVKLGVGKVHQCTFLFVPFSFYQSRLLGCQFCQLLVFLLIKKKKRFLVLSLIFLNFFGWSIGCCYLCL